MVLKGLTVDIFIEEGEKAEATAIDETTIIAVVFMVLHVMIFFDIVMERCGCTLEHF